MTKAEDAKAPEQAQKTNQKCPKGIELKNGEEGAPAKKVDSLKNQRIGGKTHR